MSKFKHCYLYLEISYGTCIGQFVGLLTEVKRTAVTDTEDQLQMVNVCTVTLELPQIGHGLVTTDTLQRSLTFISFLCTREISMRFERIPFLRTSLVENHSCCLFTVCTELLSWAIKSKWNRQILLIFISPFLF